MDNEVISRMDEINVAHQVDDFGNRPSRGADSRSFVVPERWSSQKEDSRANSKKESEYRTTQNLLEAEQLLFSHVEPLKLHDSGYHANA